MKDACNKHHVKLRHQRKPKFHQFWTSFDECMTFYLVRIRFLSNSKIQKERKNINGGTWGLLMKNSQNCLTILRERETKQIIAG
jgi:hypothetical protein